MTEKDAIESTMKEVFMAGFQIGASHQHEQDFPDVGMPFVKSLEEYWNEYWNESMHAGT